MIKKILLAMTVSFSVVVSADVFEEYEIDTTGSLPEFIESVNTFVNDNNITTGTSYIRYEKVNGVNDAEKFAKDLLEKENAPDKIKGRPEVSTLNDQKAYIEIAYDLAIANAYTLDDCSLAKAKSSPTSKDCVNLQEFLQITKKVLDKMPGTIRDLTLIRASSKVDVNEDERETVINLIYNSRTREAVWFFTIEGTM